VGHEGIRKDELWRVSARWPQRETKRVGGVGKSVIDEENDHGLAGSDVSSNQVSQRAESDSTSSRGSHDKRVEKAHVSLELVSKKTRIS